MSSLDASDIRVNGSTVEFKCPCISDKMLRMPLVDVQQVHSADGGASDRPVVSFNVNVGGVDIKNAHFNLNDRAHMDSHVLIGQNILKTGDFLIDPSQDADTPKFETVQYNAVLNYIEQVNELGLKPEQCTKLVEMLMDAMNVSEADRILFERTLEVMSE